MYARTVVFNIYSRYSGQQRDSVTGPGSRGMLGLPQVFLLAIAGNIAAFTAFNWIRHASK